MQEHLFDPYQSSKGKGHAGLGLSLCYEIVRRYNGHITCTSVPWNTTTFTIDLPLVDC